jgi:hypothetical protein
VTLLILPIADAANHHLQSDDTYWKLNVTQVQLKNKTATPIAALHAGCPAQSSAPVVQLLVPSLCCCLDSCGSSAAATCKVDRLVRCRRPCCCRCSASVR